MPLLSKPRTRTRQKGFAIISTLLALVITAMLTKAQIEGQQLNAQLQAGAFEADMTKLIAEAVDSYVMENYPSLQLSMSVTKNGLTLANGNTAGQSLSPTVANLVAMGYLPAGTTEASLYVPNGTYQIRLRREPAACTGIDCNIPGVVYIDKAATVMGTTDMNGPMVNGFVSAAKTRAMISTNLTPGQLVGVSGASITNPLGMVSGVIGASAGFGAAGFGRFLVLNDPRDPNFQGDVSVRGTVNSSSFKAQNATNTCTLAEVTRAVIGWGDVLARDSACTLRSWMNGNGQIGVANASGATTATIDGVNKTVAIYDGTGTPARAAFAWNGAGQSLAFAENLTNTATVASGNQAGIDSSGQVFGRKGKFNTAVLTDYRNVSTACTEEGEMAWTNINGSPTIMKCMSGQFVIANGSPLVSSGQACTTEGRTASTSTGISMICEGSVYKPTLQRIGPMQMENATLVSSNTIVNKPTCALNGTTAIYLLPNRVDASSGAFTYAAIDQGTSWNIEIRDNDGMINASSQAIAQTACIY